MKKYRFYGWEQADAPAVSAKYSKIENPRHLYDILSEIWCADTCAPRMRKDWTKENQTLGQCSITAFLAQDIFGGEVYGILRPGGNYHCYNVVGDCVFDLTSEQFLDCNGEQQEILCYEDNPIQLREVHFAKEEKRLRYEYLKAELEKYLLKHLSQEAKIAVVTGGAHGIGKCIAEEFQKSGAIVEVIDIRPGDHYVGDLSKKEEMEAFAEYVIKKHGRIDYLINNAIPFMKGIDECSYEEFMYALSVGVTAPFYLTKLFAPYFGEKAAIVNISSSRDRMSQAQTESYSAAKGGIAALTHSLMMSLAGKVRVNSVSPGWIDTDYVVYEGADAYQQPSGRVGNPLDIANAVLYLCSDKAGFINGENICIDGGMTKQMIYHNDYGWSLNV